MSGSSPIQSVSSVFMAGKEAIPIGEPTPFATSNTGGMRADMSNRGVTDRKRGMINIDWHFCPPLPA
jgi:hypothetical protein